MNKFRLNKNQRSLLVLSILLIISSVVIQLMEIWLEQGPEAIVEKL